MVKAIFKKEILLYFLTPFGYIFLGFFLFASGLVFVFYNIIGAKSDLYGMFGVLNYICLFVFPVLTMRIWAEEKKSYADRLLLTSPVKMRSIVIGKYLAALVIFTAALAVTGVYAAIILRYSQLSLGTVLASYLGFLFLGGAYISICFFGASLSGSQISSIIIGFAFLIGFLLVGFLANVFPSPGVQKVLNWFAIINNFDRISIGVLKVGPVYYYLSIICFFLFLTVNFLERKQLYTGREQGRKTGAFSRKLNHCTGMILVFCVLAVTNLLCDELPWSYDMTADKLFTLSEYSLKVLDDLDRPVDIAVLADEEKNNEMISVLLKKYEEANGNFISLNFIDADKDPVAVKKYDRNNQGLANGSIVFRCGDRVKVVHDFELIKENEFAPGKSFDGERLFTGAVLYVTSRDLPVVYFTSGHGEMNLDDELFHLKNRIENEGHSASAVNLASSAPDPGSAMIVTSPEKDFDQAEVQAMTEYLESGGRLMVLLDLLHPDTDMGNLKEFLSKYGISVKSNFVVEENVRQTYANNKMVIVPEYSNNEIVDMLRSRKLSVVLPYPGNLEIDDGRLENVTVEPMLLSSEESWIRYDWADETESKGDKDRSGPAVLACSVKIDNTDLKKPSAKLVVVYNSGFVDEDMINIQANYDFFIHSLNWLEDRENSLTIRPKVIDASRLMIPGKLYISLIVFCALILPLLFFLLSFYIWNKRKNL